MLAVERTAYLTIDDGPAGDFMEKVDYLNANGIRAIWFCLGEALEIFSEEAVRAIKAGHVIGIRSYDHADLSALSLKEVRGQLERTDQIVDELYRRAGVSRPSKMFRYPYVHDETNEVHFAGIQRMLEELGYQPPAFDNIVYRERSQAVLKRGIHVECTRDTFDLCADAALDEKGNLQEYNGNEIIMIHDWIRPAPFKALIDKLLMKGMAFKLPKEMSLSI